VGPFKPVLNGCKVYERRFFVRDDFIYGKGGVLRTKWALQIEGLNKRELSVDIESKSRSIRGFFAPNLLANNFLLPLLELKFFDQGYFLLHSAAVSDNKKGYLISGRGGSFKTSIVMDLIRRYGYEYLGDERVLIGFGRIFSFPMHIQIFEFLLKSMKNEFMNAYEKLRLIVYLLRNRQRKMKIANKSQLAGLLFLNPSTKPFNVKNINEKTAAKKMIANMQMEYFEMSKIIGLDVSPVFECLSAYKSAYPDSPIARFHNELLLQLEDTFSGLPIYEVSIPLEYKESSVQFINVMLNKIAD
jgi:hypothetical protein